MFALVVLCDASFLLDVFVVGVALVYAHGHGRSQGNDDELRETIFHAHRLFCCFLIKISMGWYV